MLPADMRSFEDTLERKEIVLGGCTMTGNDPKWECNECRARWRYKQTKFSLFYARTLYTFEIPTQK